MIEKKQSVEDIRDKVVGTLKGSQWDEVLRIWWQDSQFLKVIETLIEYQEEGMRFVPAAPKMLRFLASCPYNKVKALILTDEGSNLMDYNTGIPFSIEPIKRKTKQDTVKEVNLSPSLVAKNLQRHIPEEQRGYDISRWCKQGLLIVPLAPTHRIEMGGHYDLWAPTIYRILEKVAHHKDIPVILIGEKTKKYEDYLNTEHVRYINPVVREDYEGWQEWVNDRIQGNSQIPINWK